MAETAKRCEMFVAGDMFCNCPARRVSQGRHYCREHFAAVIDDAKSEVVKKAVRFTDERYPRGVYSDTISLVCAINKLKKLGWEPGD